MVKAEAIAEEVAEAVVDVDAPVAGVETTGAVIMIGVNEVIIVGPMVVVVVVVVMITMTIFHFDDYLT
jgi:hypothetical protein